MLFRQGSCLPHFTTEVSRGYTYKLWLAMAMGGNVLISLTYQALADPEWWISESNHLKGIRHPPIDATFWTDASKKGWRAA